MNLEQLRLCASLEDRHWWFAARRRIVGDLVNVLVPPSKSALVVDVGCGTGGNTGRLATQYRCIGIDASPEAVDLARERFPQATFLCGTFDDLGPQAPEVRAVLMMDVLEHVADDFEFFSKIAAALAPGAHVVVTVPAGVDLWGQHDIASLHYRRYDLERLERVWSGLPFTSLLSTPFNSRLYPLVKLARSVNARLNRTSGDQGTDLKVPIGFVNNALLKIFGSESVQLQRALGENRARAFDFGVSLIAVLRRESGEVAVRTKPAGLAPDLHDPVAASSKSKGFAR
jgi:SAM-dependent methyltransferase